MKEKKLTLQEAVTMIQKGSMTDIEIIEVASEDYALIRSKAMPEFAFMANTNPDAIISTLKNASVWQISFNFPDERPSENYPLVSVGRHTCQISDRQKATILSLCYLHGIRVLFGKSAQDWSTWNPHQKDRVYIIEANEYLLWMNRKYQYPLQFIYDKTTFINYKESNLGDSAGVKMFIKKIIEPKKESQEDIPKKMR